MTKIKLDRAPAADPLDNLTPEQFFAAFKIVCRRDCLKAKAWKVQGEMLKKMQSFHIDVKEGDTLIWDPDTGKVGLWSGHFSRNA